MALKRLETAERKNRPKRIFNNYLSTFLLQSQNFGIAEVFLVRFVFVNLNNNFVKNISYPNYDCKLSLNKTQFYLTNRNNTKRDPSPLKNHWQTLTNKFENPLFFISQTTQIHESEKHLDQYPM